MKRLATIANEKGIRHGFRMPDTFFRRIEKISRLRGGGYNTSHIAKEALHFGLMELEIHREDGLNQRRIVERGSTTYQAIRLDPRTLRKLSRAAKALCTNRSQASIEAIGRGLQAIETTLPSVVAGVGETKTGGRKSA